MIDQARAAVEAKYCRDCKFYTSSGYIPGYVAPSISWPAYCTHPERISLVSGHEQSVKPEWARSVAGDCGPDGTLFDQRLPPEPKPPKRSLWARLFGATDAREGE